MTRRFTRPRARARTLTATVGPSGVTTISTRKLRRGSYRVTVTSGGMKLGNRRLRIG